MAEKLPFGKGASVNRPPLFCGLNYQFWKVRMKIFVESIDRGIWDAIINDPFVPKHEKMMFSLENLGSNGLSLKIKRLNMIALPRTSPLS